MNDSITEVDSLEVSGIIDVPHSLSLAVVVGFDSQAQPLRSLSETACHLKNIGLTKKVMPTSTISYIEQSAFAKLRRNPKIKAIYEMLFGEKPATKQRLSHASRMMPKTDNPSLAANSLVSEMEARRRLAKVRKGAA